MRETWLSYRFHLWACLRFIAALLFYARAGRSELSLCAFLDRHDIGALDGHTRYLKQNDVNDCE